MVTIIFETHATTFDNEDRLASGWCDAELSQNGRKQAKELGSRYKTEDFAAIFCSDLKRSYKTAEIAFAERSLPIIKDSRLRECNYGDYAGESSDKIEADRINRIKDAFPGGESYEQAGKRVKFFLEELLKKYDGRKVMIIGHRATQYGLEHWINGASYKKLVTDPWKWQPGWTYNFEKFDSYYYKAGEGELS